MKDMFLDYKNMPEPLRDICDKWAEKDARETLSYKDCQEFLKEVEAIGYTFDFGLDGEPVELRPNPSIVKLFAMFIRNDDLNFIPDPTNDWLVKLGKFCYNQGLEDAMATEADLDKISKLLIK